MIMKIEAEPGPYGAHVASVGLGPCRRAVWAVTLSSLALDAPEIQIQLCSPPRAIDPGASRFTCRQFSIIDFQCNTLP